MQTALATASYRGDLERCRLLCESIDARVSGHTRHYILVDRIDLPLFAPLAGPRREIVDERALLPSWLRSFPDPASLGRRRIWLQPFGPPLRGWHVQQLRRLAMAATLREDVMVSLDSDVVFLRPFDVGHFSTGGRVRFYKVPDAVASQGEPARGEHREWSRVAGRFLGVGTPAFTDHGYVGTLIAWRTDSVRAMMGRIEAVSGKPALRALAATRRLSECTLYGRFVDEVEKRPDLHEETAVPLCHMRWTGAALGEADLADFVARLEPHQVAAGIQSFTGTSPALIRRAAGLA